MFHLQTVGHGGQRRQYRVAPRDLAEKPEVSRKVLRPAGAQLRHIRQREFALSFRVGDKCRIIPEESVFVEIPKREKRFCGNLAPGVGRVHERVMPDGRGEVPAVAKRVCDLQLDLAEELLVFGIRAQDPESPEGLTIPALHLHHAERPHPPPVFAGVIVARLLRSQVGILGLPVHRHLPVHLGGHQRRRRSLFRGSPKLCGLVEVLPRPRVVLVLLGHLSKDEGSTRNHLRLVVLLRDINDVAGGLPGILAGFHPVLCVGEKEPCLNGAGAIRISAYDLVVFAHGLLVLVLVIVCFPDHKERIIDEL